MSDLPPSLRSWWAETDPEPARRSTYDILRAEPRPRRPMPRQMRPYADRNPLPTPYRFGQRPNDYDATNLGGSRMREAMGQPDPEGHTPGQAALWEAGRAVGVAGIGDAAHALDQGDVGMAAVHAGSTLLPFAGMGLFGRGAPRAAPRIAAEPPTRLPVNPSRPPTRASDGTILPARAPQPFRQAEVGGGDDLAEAARMRRDDAQIDAGSGGSKTPFYDAFNNQTNMVFGAPLPHGRGTGARGQERFFDRRLSDANNKIVEMARNNFTNAEIAEEMATSVHNVRQSLTDARSLGIDIAHQPRGRTAGPPRTPPPPAPRAPRARRAYDDRPERGPRELIESYFEMREPSLPNGGGNFAVRRSQLRTRIRAARENGTLGDLANRWSLSEDALTRFEQDRSLAGWGKHGNPPRPDGGSGASARYYTPRIENLRGQPVLVNPSRADIASMLKEQRGMGPRSLRWMVDDSGDVFVFDGRSTLHQDFETGTGRYGRTQFVAQGEITSPQQIDSTLAQVSSARASPQRPAVSPRPSPPGRLPPSSSPDRIGFDHARPIRPGEVARRGSGDDWEQWFGSKRRFNHPLTPNRQLFARQHGPRAEAILRRQDAQRRASDTAARQLNDDTRRAFEALGADDISNTLDELDARTDRFGALSHDALADTEQVGPLSESQALLKEQQQYARAADRLTRPDFAPRRLNSSIVPLLPENDAARLRAAISHPPAAPAASYNQFGGKLAALSRTGAPEMTAQGPQLGGLLEAAKRSPERSAIDPRAVMGGGLLATAPAGAGAAWAVNENIGAGQRTLDAQVRVLENRAAMDREGVRDLFNANPAYSNLAGKDLSGQVNLPAGTPQERAAAIAFLREWEVPPDEVAIRRQVLVNRQGLRQRVPVDAPQRPMPWRPPTQKTPAWRPGL